jgi:hypothetical protein
MDLLNTVPHNIMVRNKSIMLNDDLLFLHYTVYSQMLWKHTSFASLMPLSLQIPNSVSTHYLQWDCNCINSFILTETLPIIPITSLSFDNSVLTCCEGKYWNWSFHATDKISVHKTKCIHFLLRGREEEIRSEAWCASCITCHWCVNLLLNQFCLVFSPGRTCILKHPQIFKWTVFFFPVFTIASIRTLTTY